MNGEHKSGSMALDRAFLDLPDGAAAKRAYERWPLLAAVQRVAASRQGQAAPVQAARAAAETSAWWEE
jgi:hypothetical protein